MTVHASEAVTRRPAEAGVPPGPVSSTPALAGFTTAIARAGLGAAVDDGGGTSTVTFPSPDGVPEYVPFSTAPVTVSRSLWDQAAGMAEQAASGAVDDARSAVTDRASSALDGASAAAHGAIDHARAALPGGGAGDADKQFEELYDRLKRELMIEQEQLGQLFREP